MKLPPYGKQLAARQDHNNPPMYAVVCVGLNDWARAKRWNTSKADTVAMVLPPDSDPDALTWPVNQLPIVIESDVGPSVEQIHNLAHRLLVCGAVNVLQIDLPTPKETFDRYTQYRWSIAA